MFVCIYRHRHRKQTCHDSHASFYARTRAISFWFIQEKKTSLFRKYVVTCKLSAASQLTEGDRECTREKTSRLEYKSTRAVEERRIENRVCKPQIRVTHAIPPQYFSLGRKTRAVRGVSSGYYNPAQLKTIISCCKFMIMQSLSYCYSFFKGFALCPYEIANFKSLTLLQWIQRRTYCVCKPLVRICVKRGSPRRDS